MKKLIGLALCLLLWTGLKSQVLFGEVDFVSPSDMIGSFYFEAESNIIFTDTKMSGNVASYNYSNAYATYFLTANDTLTAHPPNFTNGSVKVNRPFVKDAVFESRIIKEAGTRDEVVTMSLSYNYRVNLTQDYQLRFREYYNNGNPIRSVEVYDCGELISNNGQPFWFADWQEEDVWSIERAGNSIFYQKDGVTFYRSECRTQNTTTTILMHCFEHRFGPHLSDYQGLQIIPFTPSNMDFTGAVKSRKVDKYGDCHVIVHSWK